MDPEDFDVTESQYEKIKEAYYKGVNDLEMLAIHGLKQRCRDIVKEYRGYARDRGAHMQDVEVYINGTKLAFDSNGLSTTMFGGGQNEHFKAVKNSTGTGAVVHGIRLMRNLIKDFNFTSINIKMVGKIQYGTQLDSVQATYTIPVQKYSGNGYAVTIKAGDSKGFTIRERGTNGAVSLVASVWDIEAGTEMIDNSLTYVWEKAMPTESGWETI